MMYLVVAFTLSLIILLGIYAWQDVRLDRLENEVDEIQEYMGQHKKVIELLLDELDKEVQKNARHGYQLKDKED